MFFDFLKVFFLAMTPFGELRISIPTGIFYYHLPFWPTFFVSLIGNIFIVFLLLLFLNYLSEKVEEKSLLYKKFLSLLKERKVKKYQSAFGMLGYLALIIFVAIPLPFSGGWSGTLLASAFRVSLKKSLLLISLGIFIAGLIVGLASLSTEFLLQL